MSRHLSLVVQRSSSLWQVADDFNATDPRSIGGVGAALCLLPLFAHHHVPVIIIIQTYIHHQSRPDFQKLTICTINNSVLEEINDIKKLKERALYSSSTIFVKVLVLTV
jgi:hypothetical protein